MSATLNLTHINSQAVPTGSAGLVAKDSKQSCKAWAKFRTIHLSGTYSQNLNTITITMTAHGMTTGMIVNLDFTTGTAIDGTDFVVTVTGADTFTVVGKTSTTTSGNVTRLGLLYDYHNISGISNISDGYWYFYLAAPFASTNYVIVAMPGPDTENVDRTDKMTGRAVSTSQFYLSCFDSTTVTNTHQGSVIVFGN